MTRRTIEVAAFLAALLLAAFAFRAWLASRDDQQRLQAVLSAQQKIIASADANERARSASLNDALAQIENLKRANQTPKQIAAELQNYLSLPRPLTLADTSQKVAVSLHGPRKGTAGTNLSQPPAPSPASSESDPPQIINSRDALAAVPNPLPDQFGNSPVPFVDSCPKPTSCGTNAAPSGLAVSPYGAQAAGSNAIQDACPGSPSCTVQIPSADIKPLYNYVQDCRECQLRLNAANQNLADNATKIAALTRERDAAIAAAKGGTFWRRLRRNFLWFAIGAAAATASSAHRF